MTTTSISKICLADGCLETATRQGRCENHYRQYRRSDAFQSVQNKGEGTTPQERFWNRVAIGKPDECWNWQAGTNTFGYGVIRLNGRHIKTHRAAWFFTYGVMPTLYILHSCDNPTCVNPNHLREGTYQDNSDDKRLRGRSALGEQVRRGHLVTDDIRSIRNEYQPRTVTQASLAQKYGVCRRTIADILHRKTWKHVP